MLRHTTSFAWIVSSLLSISFAIHTPTARADDTLDLRGKIIEFSKAANEKRWKIEDRLNQREREFQDGIMLELREDQTKGLDMILNAPNWHESQRAYRDQIRRATSELRQKVRTHREEFRLTFLATTNDLEKDLKDFLDPLDKEFHDTKSEAFKKAESDFQNSRDDLKEDLRTWKERVKDTRTPDDFIPN
jgi:vacuolar-type H+-ATPase subunit H